MGEGRRRGERRQGKNEYVLTRNSELIQNEFLPSILNQCFKIKNSIFVLASNAFPPSTKEVTAHVEIFFFIFKKEQYPENEMTG